MLRHVEELEDGRPVGGGEALQRCDRGVGPRQLDGAQETSRDLRAFFAAVHDAEAGASSGAGEASVQDRSVGNRSLFGRAVLPSIWRMPGRLSSLTSRRYLIRLRTSSSSGLYRRYRPLLRAGEIRPTFSHRRSVEGLTPRMPAVSLTVSRPTRAPGALDLVRFTGRSLVLHSIGSRIKY